MLGLDRWKEGREKRIREKCNVSKTCQVLGSLSRGPPEEGLPR